MSEVDREALCALFREGNGRNWPNKQGWCTDAALWEWQGVQVNAEGRVVELHQHDEIGSIPGKLWTLTALKVLKISGKRLSGQIPMEVGTMTALTRLDLAGNGLTGQIPMEVGTMTALTRLDLAGNGLTGQIPKEVGTMTALTHLVLRSNQLTGQIPKEVGTMIALTHLGLAGNSLTGQIPKEVGTMIALTHLGLAGNRLTGQIPKEVGTMTALKHLVLRSNQLTGQIPKEVGTMIALTHLDIGYNGLIGQIPKEVGTMTALKHLVLRSNQLTGQIPKEVGTMIALKHLVLGSNQLTGQIPKEVGTMIALTHLDLAGNRLTGQIPKEVRTMIALTRLDLHRNKLTGQIPKEVGTMIALTHLDLRSNRLTGQIPKEVGTMTALTHLVLRSNRLTGQIPKEVGTMIALTRLDLAGNFLTGQIPKEVGTMIALTHLDIGYNGLIGQIPKEVGTMTALKHLVLRSNQLTGQIPKEVGTMIALTHLDLGSNQLTGQIPKEVGTMIALTHLDIGYNGLIGQIPKEVGTMITLTRVDLASNRLTGQIPMEVGTMIALTRLDLAGNFLTGMRRGEDARKILDVLSRIGPFRFSLQGNPWECPPASVVSKGIERMKKYYDELEKDDPVDIDTRKVVFIGESGAGKTSLIKSIMTGKGQLTLEEERESVGVSVKGSLLNRERDLGKGTDVKFYDLAGQVEYYGLHQLFLTENAFYVLVWDASKYQYKPKALVEHLNDWLTTLHLRAPKSTVLLCATHKDRCVPGNLLARTLARLTRSLPLDEIFKDIEKSIRDKHEQWKSRRRTGPTLGSYDEGLKLECGIELVSSCPSMPHSESGLPDLKKRLESCGKGVRYLIPPSWRIALVVLDAVRDGIQPVEAVRRHRENEDSLEPVAKFKRVWVPMVEAKLHWESVVDSLQMNLSRDEQMFALESAMDLRESGGSLLRHPEGVFLDVEDFALSLAPILNHKTQQRDGRGMHMFAGRTLDSDWMLDARTQLVSKGILEARFALFLWDKDGEDLPRQTFDVLVKLGILLPLPQRGVQTMHRGDPLDFSPFRCQHAEEYLVLMRLPLNAPDEIMARFTAFKKLEREWGVVAKWEFDSGSTPHGLVERLVASCHAIGNVMTGTYWRRGACFVANDESINAAGGSFALALHFDPSFENLNLPKAGTLVVRVFGDRDFVAVWGALRFVISSAWRLFEEFPGLGWEAWVECPTHVGQLQHYLAGVKDFEGKSPGDLLVRRRAKVHCPCPRGVASRLGKVLKRSSSLAEVFESTDGKDKEAEDSDRDKENRFKRDLDDVLDVTQELSTVKDPEEWSTPEWLKDALVAGPAGAIALYETWSPLFKVADHWREGALEEAIPLTIFAVFLTAAVFWLAAVVFRRLRLKYEWWPPRGHMKVN